MAEIKLENEEVEKAVNQHLNRVRVLMSLGMKKDDAHDLANQLFDRDHGIRSDTRHVCLECKFFNRNRRTCTNRKNGREHEPTWFLMMRCGFFSKGTL